MVRIGHRRDVYRTRARRPHLFKGGDESPVLTETVSDPHIIIAMQIRKTRWSHFLCNYHLVWIPKYRKKVLVGEVAQETERLLREVASKNDMEILALSVQPDHVHVFVSAPPRFSPAEIVNLFKGYTSRKLREKFPHLREDVHPRGLWVRPYYVGTAGHVSQETIQRYIEEAQDL